MMDAHAPAPRAPTWLVAALAAAVFAAAMAIAYRHRHVACDDALIYARSVRNVLDGWGWTFNPGRRLDTSTSPLYFLLLLGTSAATGRIEPSMAIIFGVTLGAAAVLLFLGLRRTSGLVMAILAAFGFLRHPFGGWLYGLEMPLLLATTLAALLAYQAERLVLAAVLLAAAVLARGEGILLAALVLGHYMLTRRRLPPFAAIVAFVAPLLAWSVVHVVHFHALFPESLAAKTAQGRTGKWNSFPLGLALAFYADKPTAWQWAVLGGLAAAALALPAMAVRRDVVALLLVLFALAHVAAYTAMNVASYPWHYALEYLAWWYVVPTALALAYRIAGERGWLRTEGGFAVIGWGAMAAATLLALEVAPRRASGDACPSDGYYRVARQIEPLLRPGDRLLSTEIGTLGWMLPDAAIEDTVGLTDLVHADELARGQFNAWLSRPDALPEYALLLDRFAPMTLDGDEAVAARFDRYYAPVLNVEDENPGFRGHLYARRPGPLPEPPWIDVLQLLEPARLRPPVVMLTNVVAEGRVQHGLFEHPTSTFEVDVAVSKRWLVFGYGLLPDVYDKSDGAGFAITVESGGTTTPVFTSEVHLERPEERTWHHACVDLERWRSANVVLAFSTVPLATPSYDQAVWLSLRLDDDAGACGTPTARAGETVPASP
jgi:hypothetical protein